MRQSEYEQHAVKELIDHSLINHFTLFEIYQLFRYLKDNQ
jgi:hypothetical protein